MTYGCEARVGRATPLRLAQSWPVVPWKVSGTRPGRGATSRRPNWRARRCARSLPPSLGQRETAAGDHHRAGAELAGVGEGDGEPVGGGARNRANVGVGFDADPGVGALGGEEVDDVARGAVAEELAEGFLVVGDPVALDEVDEILRGVA